MAEGTVDVEINHARRAADDDQEPRSTADAIGGEIAVLRQELDTLLGELDRRRREALDLRLQLRRHALGVTLTTVAFVGTAAASVWLAVWRQRRRQTLAARTGRLKQAISRMTEHPDRVAAEPTMTGKIVRAAVSAALAALLKKLLERGVDRVLHDRPAAVTQPVPLPEPGGPHRRKAA